MTAKEAVLHFSKWVGLFHLARWRQPRGLRILCYHGFALADEFKFRPKLFIRPETFEKRLRFIAQQHFPVLNLAEALDRLSRGQLPPGATVITIDDGFYGVFSVGAPLLEEFSFPATVYVTTYYCVKQTPIFRIAMHYMFWKTKQAQLDLEGLNTPFKGRVRWQDQATRDRLMWDLIGFGERQSTEEQRIELAREIGHRLGVDYDSIARRRIFSIMTIEELRKLLDLGFDLELHTHRHQLLEEDALIRREIRDNRAVLEPLVGRPLEHLCYPSGVWSTKMWPSLERLGIRSATTCLPGLNGPDTPRLGLKRYLDGENISQIDFEAEMCGFNDLLHLIRARLTFRPAASTSVPRAAPLDAGLSHSVKR